MATLRDIKNRIKGVKNTQQITKAMKMVAASKLRRAQESIVNARPYAKKIAEMFSNLVTDEDMLKNPLIAPREKISNVAIVVVTADRGLCGAFNTNIIREANRYINDEIKETGNNYQMYCIGKKGSDFFGKRNYSVAKNFPEVFTSLNYTSAQKVSDELAAGYLKGDFDKVILIFNEFKSLIHQKIVVEQFLPIPVQKDQEDESVSETYYIYEPDQKSIFNYLIPKLLRGQIWRILLESNAAEFASRMTAMDNATTNAKELIRTLNLTYNKARQAAITKEILEIVSGANALRQSA